MSRLTVVSLRKVANRTLPIYQKIAGDAVYATRLTQAIRSNNLNALGQLLRQATFGFNDFGTNGFGFNIGFAAPLPANQVENAITKRGTVKPTTVSLRSIARRLLRLLRRIAADKAFATQLVLAARKSNNLRLRALVAPLLPSGSLVAARGDSTGIVLEIKASTGAVFVTQFFVL
ncbi:hypothetical protein [Paenibacillus andongensis]|uniref:hypothetical protein n=1 Tax=Paenibacillus andongensis TaxID=2975482 RepID=UPI0021BB79E9|nr:hypothetical protein [Paenibacillus andongensis]